MDKPENDDPKVAEFLACLAWDELDQVQDAYTPEHWTDLMARMDKRRDTLDDLSGRRYEAAIGDHDKIQALFDFLALELGEFDGALGQGKPSKIACGNPVE